MPAPLSDLATCYVVLWSPRQRIFQTEKFSDLMERNLTFFLREQRSGIPDWLVLGVARTAQGAAEIRMQAGQQISERHRKPSAAEIDAQQEAWLAGEVETPKPPKPPWWFSEK